MLIVIAGARQNYQDLGVPTTLENDSLNASSGLLHVKLWQKEDNIEVNGWRIVFSDLDRAYSERGDQPEPAHSQLQNI